MRTTSSEPSRYTLPAVLLHWVMGVGLIGLLAFGWYISGLPFSPAKLKYINWHKWVGVALLALGVARLLWRLTHRPPALPAAVSARMPHWQHVLHHSVHGLLYALLLAVPLLGWAYSSAAGFPVVWLGLWRLPDLVAADPALAAQLQQWHMVAAYTLAALIALHVAAALKHHFIDRDGLLARMRFGR